MNQKKVYDLIQSDGKISLPLDQIDRIHLEKGDGLLIGLDPSQMRYQHTIGQVFEKAFPGVPVIVYPKDEINIKLLRKT